MEITTHIYDFDLFDEKEYKNIRKKLKMNDVLIIKSLSAIGESRDDIQKELNTLTKRIKADLVVLDMPLFDTRVNKEINGTLITDLVIETLACSQKIDRNFRKQRQTEGIAQAHATGVKFGRPAEPYPRGFMKVYKRVIDNKITKTEGSKELGITFHKMSRLVERKTRELNVNQNDNSTKQNQVKLL